MLDAFDEPFMPFVLASSLAFRVLREMLSSLSFLPFFLSSLFPWPLPLPFSSLLPDEPPVLGGYW